MDRDVKNIVFYKVNNNNEEKIQSCIFFRNGKIINTTYEKGVKECVKLAKIMNIKNKEELKKIINKKYIHVVSEEDFKTNFSKYQKEETQKDNNLYMNHEKFESKEKKEKKEDNEEKNYRKTKDTKKKYYDEYYDDFDEYYDDFDDYYDYLYEYGYYDDDYTYVITDFFKSIKEKISKTKIGKKLASLGLSLALIYGTPIELYNASTRNSINGNIEDSNIKTTKILDINNENEYNIKAKKNTFNISKTPDISDSSINIKKESHNEYETKEKIVNTMIENMENNSFQEKKSNYQYSIKTKQN